MHKGVSLSTAEAEYVAATEAAKDVMWVRHLLTAVGMTPKQPTRFFEDNEACIHMSKNPVISGRNKHMELRAHYIRELRQKNCAVLEPCSSQDQVADIFTKNLPKPAFMRHRRMLLKGLQLSFSNKDKGKTYRDALTMGLDEN